MFTNLKFFIENFKIWIHVNMEQVIFKIQTQEKLFPCRGW